VQKIYLNLWKGSKIMAIMIPPKIESGIDFDTKSREDVVFHCLKSGLNDNYIVVHSVDLVGTSQTVKAVYDHECDFVIIHRQKGILLVEAKAGGDINYRGGRWNYSNGKPLKHSGPFKQIEKCINCVLDKFNNDDLLEKVNFEKRCKLIGAVWFIEMNRSAFGSEQFERSDLDMNRVICADDMSNITQRVNSIFDLSIRVGKEVQTHLSDEEFERIKQMFCCDEFNLISTGRELVANNIIQLTREQYVLLDFLQEQKSAVISGAAGTGKTMLALEKARRHSVANDKVLFMCYNSMLCQDLIKKYVTTPKDKKNPYRNIDFVTIDKLLNKYGVVTYRELADKICSTFEYDHVIIDEGQDFGMIDIETGMLDDGKEDVINALKLQMEDKDGTFYLFYDKYQSVQGGSGYKFKLLDCIRDCECRLTLHKNCRNTDAIAKTSVTSLVDNARQELLTRIKKYGRPGGNGETIKPELFLKDDDKIKKLNGILDEVNQSGLDDVVILTLKTIETSFLPQNLQENEDGYKMYPHSGKYYRFTTCRKFKGLEADAVIVIDIDESTLTEKDGTLFYVATSRAKYNLYLLTDIEKNDEWKQCFKKMKHMLPKIDEHFIGDTFYADVR